jgi:hypothetical protein
MPVRSKRQGNWFGLAIAALVVLPAPAEAAHQLVQSVRSGRDTVIAYNWWFNPGPPVCRPGPRPRAIIVQPPQFGSVRIINGQGVVNETSNGCYGRRSQSVGIIYRSRPGFVGSDSFMIEWRFPDGRGHRSRYSFPVN